jgi:transcriptional regulator with XRE-family HTH domain
MWYNHTERVVLYMTNFPVIIKELRKSEKLTQQEMANVLNVSQEAYGRYERGEREPSMAILANISKFFQVPIDFLAGGFLWFVDPNYKDITEHYDINNMKAVAKTIEQVLELARAKVTKTEPVNVFEDK